MRGDVFSFKPGKQPQGHEQKHRRYAIVVQASRFVHLSTWLVVPTSTSAQEAIFRPQITVPTKSPALALCDALVSIDPEQRLGEYIGVLPFQQMQEIDSALQLLLEIDSL